MFPPCLFITFVIFKNNVSLCFVKFRDSSFYNKLRCQKMRRSVLRFHFQNRAVKAGFQASPIIIILLHNTPFQSGTFCSAQRKFNRCKRKGILRITQPIPLTINIAFKIFKGIRCFTILNKVIYIFGIGRYFPSDCISPKRRPRRFIYRQFKSVNLIDRVRNRFTKCGIFRCDFQSKPNPASAKHNEKK